MPTPSYRVNLSFDADRKVWKARAPELEHCAGEGPTRSEAIARLEEEIDAQVQNMLSQGSHPPTPLDETTLTGELQLKVSAALHRDLLWQARQENVDVEHLMAEMLAAGLESRRGARPQRQQQNRPAQDPDNIGNSVGRDRGNRGNGARYNPQLMEDRANFIEYVRNLEHNGGVPGGAGPGRGPGGGGGGGRQNNDRRRNRGPRGPGGAQNAGGGGGGGRGF